MLTSASGIGSLELVSSTFPLTTVLWAMPVKPTKNKVQIDKMNLFILLVKIFMISLLFKTSAKLHYLRSEEHTSELQSRPHLVCRLLLEKKKKIINRTFR